MDVAVTGPVSHLRDPAAGEVSHGTVNTLNTINTSPVIMNSTQNEPAFDAEGGNASNGKTALVLVSIALVFFAGVIANRILFG